MSVSTTLPYNIVYKPNTYNTYNLLPLYQLLQVDEKDGMPEAVYMDGLFMTLGIIGSEAQCAYLPGCLIFSKAVGLNGNISVVFDDKIDHYKVHDIKNHGLLDADLISSINRKHA